jgi:integrase
MTDKRKRQQNRGLRKICDCPRRTWAKCPHSWHFSFKPKGRERYRFSVDTEIGKHIEAKTEAEALADDWRSQIRAGTFRRQGDAPAVTVAEPPALSPTFSAFTKKYIERCEPPVSSNDRGCLRKFAAFAVDGRALGDWPIDTLTEDTVDVFFAALRKDERAVSTRNKYIQAIKAAFRWATKKGYLARNPIADADNLTREKHAQRDRRLAPDVFIDGKLTQEGDERRLLAVGSPYLQRVSVGALETCCRRGELLALQWRDVDLQKRELLVRAVEEGAKKTGVGRRLPISGRLAAMLEMAKTAMETTLKGALPKGVSDDYFKAALGLCYVFGDEAGLKVGSFKRAWETAVLKAHGHTPQWTKTNKALTKESREALDAIDLHFHDLRHEGGSRLLEAGWPLHHIQHMLGHANLSQTSTYLNVTRIGLHESMRRFDESAPRGNPVAIEAKTVPPLPRHEEAADEPKVIVN